MAGSQGRMEVPGEGRGDPGRDVGPRYTPTSPAHSLRTVTATAALRFRTLSVSVRTSQE